MSRRFPFGVRKGKRSRRENRDAAGFEREVVFPRGVLTLLTELKKSFGGEDNLTIAFGPQATEAKVIDRDGEVPGVHLGSLDLPASLEGVEGALAVREDGEDGPRLLLVERVQRADRGGGEPGVEGFQVFRGSEPDLLAHVPRVEVGVHRLERRLLRVRPQELVEVPTAGGRTRREGEPDLEG